MIIETKKLKDLKPAPYNPRKSTERQEGNLKASLEKFGVVEPIIFNKQTGFIVGGHFRVRELKKLGFKEVECVIVDLNEADEKELNIRLNANTGEWDMDLLDSDFDSEDLQEWGLELLSFESEEQTEKEEKELISKNVWIPDCLFESNNLYDIPTLKTEYQANELLLPFKGWGMESRQKSTAAVWHFYVDDYRFEALWSNPEKIVNSGCTSIVEPNLSLFDTTPTSYGIHLIYKKRWLARLMQKFGITVFADLNVSLKFAEYNKLGIPQGYNSFCTRGYAGKEKYLENEIAIAKEISGLDTPFMVVYGGGNKCKEIANKHNLIFVNDLMTEKNIHNGKN